MADGVYKLWSRGHVKNKPNVECTATAWTHDLREITGGGRTA